MKPVEPIEEMSPVQELLYDRLKDGRYHSSESLMLIINPEGKCKQNNLSTQLWMMRKRLRERGQDVILIQADRRAFYQLTVRSDWPELFPRTEEELTSPNIPDGK